MVLQHHRARRGWRARTVPAAPVPQPRPGPAAGVALLKWRLPARLQPGLVTWPPSPVIASAGGRTSPKPGRGEGAGLIRSDGPGSQLGAGARLGAGEGRCGAERALRRGPRCGARSGGAGGRAGGVCAGAWGAAPAFGAASAGRQPPVSAAEAPRAERRRPGRAGGSAEGREGGGAAGLPFSARAAAGGGGEEGACRLCGGSPQGCRAPAVPSPSPWARETGWCQGRGPALPGSRRCAGSFFPPRVLLPSSSRSLALAV